MSIRFAIRDSRDKAIKEGDTIVRFSGRGEPFYKVSERASEAVGFTEKGEPRLIFNTGLDEKSVDRYSWYSKEEKEVVKKQIEELKPLIYNHFGGEEVLSKTNTFFWGRNRDVSRVALTHNDLDIFYDTKSPIHALLYLSIISGSFDDLIAPTKDYAERRQLPLYLQLETEDTYEEEDEMTRMDAMAALADLKKNAEPDALFIIAWCIQYHNKTYGAYHRSTPVRDLVNYHIKYIDGKLEQKDRKRDTTKVFLEYAKRWEGQQTRPGLYTEAYVKAGDYYNFIKKNDKKFSTADGVPLGSNITAAIETLGKAKFSEELAKLRDQVEAKWKE